ncbi:TonB-dependent receptor plug domain-containing protein [Parvularcula dongshanensis]|uniref:Outer membrane cobalamin receptor n=1 Tax=Parvularcula dongshanensis TaxID=1173995 RepID=A0A840I5I5_9PROT|nr:TonB-dependent receptor plug domain-containing protein [Parvularcula dongshanensis]MBB4659585.1 outer membrane cobalamin receptor [Parvularcula dongshanensis]
MTPHRSALDQRHRALGASLAALTFLGFQPAYAQDEAPSGDVPALAAPQARKVAAAQTYTAEDFARFKPRTALDMLRQVPGFVIRQAEEEERGLGQASTNVLIDGKRVSTKSNDVVTELTRVPAATVTRIELLDGATLDIPGLSGQVANVVTESGRINGQFAWEPQARPYHTDPLLTRGSLSLSGTLGPVDYTLGLENRSSRSGAGGGTVITSPLGVPVEYRDDVWSTHAEQPRISSRFAIDGPGSSVGNLNFSYGRLYYDYVEYGERTRPDGDDRDRDVVVEQNGYDYEIGGDWEFSLGTGRLKLIGLDRFEHEPFRQTIFTRPLAGALAGDRFVATGDSTERIGRAEYRMRALGGDWQLSGEVAFNALDNVSALYVLGTDGAFEAVPYPEGTGRVEEERYETIVSYGRPLSPSVTLQLAGGAEYSELRQIGNGGQERSFLRPKGSVSLAWKPSAKTDISLRAERAVGQLDFIDFLAQVDLDEENENAGNPDIVPQQSWSFEAEGKRGLGPWGSTTLRVYAESIQDIVDFVPIGEAGESPGNIDHAVIRGAEWASTLQLDPAGLPGMKLDALIVLQDSRLDDPLTGRARPISDERQRLIELNFRHDVPHTDWAWGSDLYYERAAKSYRLTELGRLYEGPVWFALFAENKDVFGLTMRLSVDNILGGRSRWERIVYEERRTGPVAYFEDRDRLIGPIFGFSVSGSF